ncbi:MAG: metalloprotease family protein [Pedobacter sp.]
MSVLRHLLSYITFPGVIVHEFAHAWACRRMGIHVHKICYLRLGNPMGYVLHEQPVFVFQHIMVAVAPFFVSTALALAVSLSACVLARSQVFPEIRDMGALAAVWFSFSLALHAFPSNGDADSLWADVKSPDISLFAKLLLVPVVGLIRLAQMGTCLWLDVLFALLVVALPPTLLLVIS